MSDLIKSSAPDRRLVDLGAMLRVMKPLDGHTGDPVIGKRRLLADLCRLVGASIGKAPTTTTADRSPRGCGRRCIACSPATARNKRR